MIDISKEADACASWPTRERLRALKRIIHLARVEEVLARTGHDRAHCPRLPGWFMVWFVIAGSWAQIGDSTFDFRRSTYPISEGECDNFEETLRVAIFE